jgi:hypothetical protein
MTVRRCARPGMVPACSGLLAWPRGSMRWASAGVIARLADRRESCSRRAAGVGMMRGVDWSWVATEEEAEERREHARRLAGLRLTAVRYVLIDYGHLDRGAGSQGPRLISTEAELADPVWRCDGFDWADFGVEFTASSGRVFTVSWDSPGWHEGIWIRELAARESAYAQDANVAVWDVTSAGHWDTYIGAMITDVVMHYRPWGPGDGLWCSRITLHIAGSPIHLLLGDRDGSHQLVPAADSIAVLFPPARLPEWERYGH